MGRCGIGLPCSAQYERIDAMTRKLFSTLLVSIAAILSLGVKATTSALNESSSQQAVIAHIRVVFNNAEVIIGLFDTSASRDLLAQLPLTLNFSDYANAEKIAYPPKKLNTRNMLPSSQLSGDFTYYAPWGNIAIFYRGYGTNSQLYTLGHIESGKEKLAEMRDNFTAVIERVD